MMCATQMTIDFRWPYGLLAALALAYDDLVRVEVRKQPFGGNGHVGGRYGCLGW
jgi:hypothetical protein